MIKTSVVMSSREPQGRRFPAQLTRNVVVGGKVVIPAGTKVMGQVKSPSFTVGSTTRPLTLRLVEIDRHGQVIPIKTHDLELDNMSPWSVGARRIQVTGAAYVVPLGTIFQFRLKAPFEI